MLRFVANCCVVPQSPFRMPRRSKLQVLVVVFLAFVVTNQADAGIITALVPDAGGTFTGIPGTPAPNNDNVSTAGPNTVDVTSSSLTGNPLDVVSDILLSGGTTEYYFTQVFTNQTSFTWGGVSLSLGTGTGASFMQSLPGDGLDFDTPDKDPSPFSNAFVVDTHDPDFLLFFGGGTVAPGDTLTLMYSMDIPDRDFIDPSAWTPSGYQMTLRFAAIPIPEPSTAMMFGLGLLLLSRERFRQKL